MTTQIHADRSQRALVHGARLPWVASPEPGVERRMLERYRALYFGLMQKYSRT